MQAIIDFLLANWFWVGTIAFLVIDKIVAMTSVKWDDIIWTGLKWIIRKLTGKTDEPTP